MTAQAHVSQSLGVPSTLTLGLIVASGEAWSPRFAALSAALTAADPHIEIVTVSAPGTSLPAVCPDVVLVDMVAGRGLVGLDLVGACPHLAAIPVMVLLEAQDQLSTCTTGSRTSCRPQPLPMN